MNIVLVTTLVRGSLHSFFTEVLLSRGSDDAVEVQDRPREERGSYGGTREGGPFGGVTEMEKREREPRLEGARRARRAGAPEERGGGRKRERGERANRASEYFRWP